MTTVKIDWDDRKWGGNPCACCGLVVSQRETPIIRNVRGIRVCPGVETEEQTSEKRTIKHVFTKNGPITVDVLNVR